MALEQHFPGDRLSRRELRHFLLKAHADLWVYVEDGKVLGDAIVLYRRGFASARLYSLVVDPSARGRGVAAALLQQAEKAALDVGCVLMRLEVREDNHAAIRLYQQHGYQIVGHAADYYEDHSSAIRMRKALIPQPPPDLRPVPYYPQSLDFTCGPAALMMAMKSLGLDVALSRGLELQLWREATTVFMMSGYGGCSAHGLGVAALRRGLAATVYSRDEAIPFLDTVRSAEKKEVISLSHAQFLEEFAQLGGRTIIKNFTVQDVIAELEQGALPLVLISTYRLYGEKMPHWLLVVGYDRNFLYLHDPYIPEGTDRADSINLPLRREDFERVSRFGKARHRYMLAVSRPLNTG